MKYLLLIPSFLIFLYCLYKMVKDDYLFIRRNISLEQVFDIGFSITFICLLFSRLFYYIYHPTSLDNFFVSYFSFQKGGLSLIGAVIGGIIGLFFIGKYKKVPLGRLFDFFMLSFLISLPFGFLSQIIFLKKSEVLIYIINALIYLILTIFFIKVLYPKVLNRTMKEGNLSIYFLIFFAIASFISSLLHPVKQLLDLVNLQNISYVAVLFFSLILLFKQERSSIKGRKPLIKK